MNFVKNPPPFSADQLNSFMTSLNEKSPILAATLGSLLERGRIYVFGSKLAEEFRKNTSLTVHVTQTPINSEILSLNTEDIYFIQTDSATHLIELSGKITAQIVCVSDSQLIFDNLFDYKINFSDLQSLYPEFNNALSLLQNKYAHSQINTHGPRPAIFLDRDGVVVEHIDHLCRTQDVRLNSGISDFIKTARLQSYIIIIVTNQSGIGRQLFTQSDYDQVTQKMLQLLANEQTFIDQILFSPYYEKSKLLIGLIRKSFRKPRAGMLLAAARELNIDLKNSILVGDRATDLMAGVLADLSQVYLLESLNSQQEEIKFNEWSQNYPIKIDTTFLKAKNFKDIKLKNRQI